MRRITISTIFVAALLLATSASARHTRHKVPVKCSPGHSRLIAADTQAQVYVAPEPGGGFLDVYGCIYGHTRAYVLGPAPEECLSPHGCVGIERETLAGPMVAYEDFSASLNEHRWYVIVRDLRNGRTLHRIPTGTPGKASSLGGLLVGDGPAVAIVVKNNGAVAWIVETGFKPATYEVHAVDRTGSRLLASGTDIDPHSLALAGSTLYWTQGGKPFSASLN